MKHIILILLLFGLQRGVGQNLIVNPSFEDTIPIAVNPNFGGPETAPPWFTPTCGASPDYFSETYYGININAPSNVFGYQFPRTGVAYCGFETIVPSNPNRREFISYRLSIALIQNHNYYFGFYVSCGDSERYATDMMGAYFSVDTPDFCLGFIYTPQVNNQPGNILSDTTNWVLISGQFVAQGGELVISIGNFFPDSQTQYSIINPNASPPYSFAYYYIDDVTLIDCTAVGIKENDALQCELISNPVKDRLQFTTGTKVSRCFIYDVLGKELLSFNLNESSDTYTVNVTDLKQGMYLLIVEDRERKRGVKKFLKE